MLVSLSQKQNLGGREILQLHCLKSSKLKKILNCGTQDTKDTQDTISKMDAMSYATFGIGTFLAVLPVTVFNGFVCFLGAHTFDTFSDIGFGLWLYGIGHPTYGLIMISPVVLVNIFTFFHWWNIENTLKKRICTLPIFILQIWSQYRVARILYFGLYRDKNGTKWKEEKLIYDKNLSCLGKESKFKCMISYIEFRN